MLVKCPECELQVSSNAVTCPHCGYPLKPTRNSRPRATSNKRRRLPNGFGQISEIKGRNLRKPFRAMVTVGKTESGRPICKPLKPVSYFATYNDAYLALAEYNKNPYDADKDITVKELFDRWSSSHLKKMNGEQSFNQYNTAWAYCSYVYDIKVSELRVRHIKNCMENGVANIKGKEHHTTPSVQAMIKTLFNVMLDYAVEYEMVDKNYSRTFALPTDVTKTIQKSRKEHIPFTDAEIQSLWDSIDTVPYVDVLLVQCYTGMRPQEIGLIELKNVDMNRWCMTGGIKTEAGTNRLIPIHTRIRPIVEKWYNEASANNCEYLFFCNDKNRRNEHAKLDYERYKWRFEKIQRTLNLDGKHRPHDGRVHFVTMAKKYDVDEYAIKYIVGHAITDITEKVYTHRELDWLQTEIEKIR